MERYDHQLTLVGTATARVEDVYLLSNTAQEATGTASEETSESGIPLAVATNGELQLVPLGHRPESLQLNMKALDESGANLVLLSKDEIEAIYAELFIDAIAYLRRRRRLPKKLAELVRSSDWEERLFHGSWLAEARVTEGFWQELTEYFYRRILQFANPPTEEELAALVFMDYVLGKLRGTYRPLVYLRDPVRGVGASGIPNKVLIKYVVDDRSVSAAEDRFRAVVERIKVAILGYRQVQLDFPVDIGASTHLRFRPPAGLVLAEPMQHPAGVRASIERNQVQFYLPKPHLEDEASPPPTRVPFQARITQTASMRGIVAILFAVMALLPGLLIETEIYEKRVSEDPRYSFGDLLGEFNASLILPTLRQARFEYVAQTFQIAVPLAVGLFAASWDRPHVRAFAVTQLVIAVFFTLLWLGATIVPLGAVVAIIGGVVLAALNIIHGIRAEGDLPG